MDDLQDLRRIIALERECGRLRALLEICRDTFAGIRHTHDGDWLLAAIDEELSRGNAAAQPPDKPSLRDSAGGPKA